MLECHHRAAQSAIPVGGGCVVTKQVALLINVLMWHYSGLYPPPFRLGFHTGRERAVGISLNKHSNRILPDCVIVFGYCGESHVFRSGTEGWMIVCRAECCIQVLLKEFNHLVD